MGVWELNLYGESLKWKKCSFWYLHLRLIFQLRLRCL